VFLDIKRIIISVLPMLIPMGRYNILEDLLKFLLINSRNPIPPRGGFLEKIFLQDIYKFLICHIQH